MRLKILRKDQLRNVVCLIVGTRPGIIKFSPLIRELDKRAVNFFVIHTSQHYSYFMDRVFFKDLDLAEPKYRLRGVSRCKLHGEQTATMLKGIEKILVEERPKIVVVGGDANTNLAGALAARKLQMSVGHIEAGLRSDDWRMPEEHNRIMIDHISEYLFAPTERAKQNLMKDGVKGKIYVTGNTIVDAVKQNLHIAKNKSKILDELNNDNFFLVTLHREENIDVIEDFVKILDGLKKVAQHFDYELIFTIHPRTRMRIKEFKLTLPNNVRVLRPIGYLDFLLLLSNSELVLTDSGGIQEESCILKVPCVTLRKSTERPETVEVGANSVSGLDPDKILKAVETMLNAKRNWTNPFGENVAEKIVNILERELEL